ncbi:hypothetical protein [Gaetbulibacter aestuarii]|uniref:DUF2812 domain-containing protein n=1 Tax=Gaetbulibacter aestuarii TaxID=1502358 RepID=A0ABW7N0E5_9FLAO
MKIIPYQKLEFRTSLSETELEQQLSENIMPKRGIQLGFSKKADDKIFEGTFSYEQFNIQRVIYYKNSFLPQVQGSYRNFNSGTTISVVLKMHDFVSIFMIIWLSLVSVAFIFTLYGVMVQETTPIAVIFPLVMLAFGFSLPHLAFQHEKKKTISALEKMLNASPK